jgi:hypothetical protein
MTYWVLSFALLRHHEWSITKRRCDPITPRCHCERSATKRCRFLQCRHCERSEVKRRNPIDWSDGIKDCYSELPVILRVKKQ